jgi:uncharacterized protein (DUF488 family)
MSLSINVQEGNTDSRLIKIMLKREEDTVYTIGHSNHSFDYLLELLTAHSINCIIDVRSVPASSYNPQFNKDIFKNSLKEHKILYMHFGDEFGARHTATDLLDTFGKVDFTKVRKSQKFSAGIDRLNSGLEKGYNISLLCSEAEPFDCHRFAMISYYLVRNGYKVKHILKDKTILDNEELEKRLLTKYDKQIPKTDLFNVFSEDEQLDLAYRLRNQEVAYDTLNN